MRHTVALILLLAALSATLLSDIGPLLMIGILGGAFVTVILQFLSVDGRTDQAKSDVSGAARIDCSKIPIGGGIGAGILIVILLTGVLLDLPMLRLMVAPGILAGLLFAGVLRLWRGLHPTRKSSFSILKQT